MPAKPRKIPAYRLHKPTGQGVVRLDGRDFYLGRHGTPESQEAYHRKVAEWISSGVVARLDETQFPALRLSVNELLLAFWRHAESYYNHVDGSPSAELENLRLALRPLRQLYGTTNACDFGPKALKAVRQGMVDSGLCRRTINQRIARVVRVFRFGVENELVSAAVLPALKAVPGLRSGRSGAKESRTVKPVPEEHVDAVRPYLPRQLWAIVELQRLTGMRSGEVLIMRTCDLETSGTVWEFTPGRHKTLIHGKKRQIHLGPRAQEVFRPWLRSNTTEYLFQPREAMEDYLAERRRNRKTPLTPSQRKRTRKTSVIKAPRDHYDSHSYLQAIVRACAKAGVPHWHPHQLRHNAATFLRREFGLEVARVILGHSSPSVTEVYAEVDREKARAVVERVG